LISAAKHQQSALDGTPLMAATRYSLEVLSRAFDRVGPGLSAQRSGVFGAEISGVPPVRHPPTRVSATDVALTG
jgi:hypothetical protein